jgi:hypothetical protein
MALLLARPIIVSCRLSQNYFYVLLSDVTKWSGHSSALDRRDDRCRRHRAAEFRPIPH